MTREPAPFNKVRPRVALGELLEPALAQRAVELPVVLLPGDLSGRARASVDRLVRGVLETPVWSDSGCDYATQLFLALLLDSLFEVESLARADVLTAALRWLFCPCDGQ